MITNSFKRYELKYLLTREQFDAVLSAVKQNAVEDEYGKTTILNVYYDTPDKLLIRRSVERPVYKEKLRLRSYGVADNDSTVFLEIKKKYESVVYKRRETLKFSECKTEAPQIVKDSRIATEIRYFQDFYKNLEPSAFISYNRQAYYDVNDGTTRITFDTNILYRNYDMNLNFGVYGKEILPPGVTLMEIKVAAAVPTWLTKVLSERKIYKTTFSKYGAAYADMIKNKGEQRYAKVI